MIMKTILKITREGKFTTNVRISVVYYLCDLSSECILTANCCSWLLIFYCPRYTAFHQHFGSDDVTSVSFAFNWSRRGGAMLHMQRGNTLYVAAQTRNKGCFCDVTTKVLVECFINVCSACLLHCKCMWCDLGESVESPTCYPFSVFYLIKVLIIGRGTFCWKPDLNWTSVSKVIAIERFWKQ